MSVFFMVYDEDGKCCGYIKRYVEFDEETREFLELNIIEDDE